MIYHIFANRSNIGDWLSAKGIQKLLHPFEVTELLCDVPFVDDTMQKLSTATKKDLIIIGGGGLLMDYFNPFWEAFNSIASHIPFCIWGIGVCDIKYESSLPPIGLIEKIVNQSKICIVRDLITKSFLRNCRLRTPVPCPSLNITYPQREKSVGLLHVVNYTTAGAKTYDIMLKAAQYYTQKTGRIYRETNNRIIKGNAAELNTILKNYHKSDVVLSSGLHGCILGLAMGLKVLAVSGDRKIDNFMEAVGLKNYCLDFSKVNLVPYYLNNLKAQTNPQSTLDDIRRKNETIAAEIKRIASTL